MSARIRTLEGQRHAALSAAQALTASAETENRDLTPEEVTKLQAHLADAESAKAQIDVLRSAQLATAGLRSTDGGRAVDIGAARVLETTNNADADLKQGFKAFGEFAGAVASSRLTGRTDERLRLNAAAPGTVAVETNGADGGFAIPPQFSTDIWRLSLGEGSLLSMTANTETTSNSMAFPKDESTPWGGTGVQAYWQSEATAANATKPVLSMQTMILHKLMALVPVSNELIEDGFALGSYMQPLVADRIQWKTNESILFGDGVGKPLGALNGPSKVIRAKESGQSNGTLLPQNLSGMVSQLLVGNLSSAIWVAQPDILVPLESMTLGQYPIYLSGQTSASAPYGLLKGRPLMLSEHASALYAQGDINLVSMKGYRTLTKAGGLKTETSMHLYFDADATAFRVTFRLNGAPIMSAPVTPPTGKSTTPRSHFVTMAAR